jgi:tRNA (guanine-N7-)-methyltransferase
MQNQEIRTFGRRHGKKLSTRKTWLMDNVLPALTPKNIKKAGDLILEIGFGNGEHVRDLAQKYPDSVIIGAEPFANGVAALLSAICDDKTNAVKPEYNNIRIWPDDVRDYLRDTDSQFSQIWVLHPDPWPKARHEKRRLLSAEFIKTLATHLSTGGQIIIGTDHWEYFDWICEQIKTTNLKYTTPDIETIHTRYAEKNMAETVAPKYIIIEK